MTFWDVLLGASSIISTGIITYIPLKFDIHKRRVHNAFLTFAFIAVCTGIWSLVNLWRDSVNSDKEKTKQQEAFTNDLKKIKTESSEELINTRNYIVDSMTSIYKNESIKQKKQIDSIEESRQRKITNVDRNRLLKRLNDTIKSCNASPTKIMIAINCELGDVEGKAYATEIFYFLKKSGYNVLPAPTAGGGNIIGNSYLNPNGLFKVICFEGRQVTIDVGGLKSRP